MSAVAPSPVRTLVVDDEPLALKRLRALLAREPDVAVVGEATSGAAAVREILALRPDLLLLDIQMPGKDGFEVLEEIAGKHDPMVVFVTAHDDHAIRAFEVAAVDYVLKPVLEDRLRAAVRRAIARRREQSASDVATMLTHLVERVRSTREPERIAVKHDGRLTFVSLSEIDRVDADGDLVKIHAGRETHVMRATMSDIGGRLGRGFLRVHRSTIVNVRRIREIQPWFKGDYVIVMHDGTKVRSGRGYRDTVQALMRGQEADPGTGRV